MASGVVNLVRLGDDTFGVDQVADSLGEVGERFVGSPLSAVGGANRAVSVGQQRERQISILMECVVVFRAVEGDAEDFGADFEESFGLITQAVCLHCSTGGRRLGVPPQQYPRASQL